jgi:hypothetical protein
MAAYRGDPHYSVGVEDALAGRPPYVFQDALYQAHYDRGYLQGELILIDREYRRDRSEDAENLKRWSGTIDAFERKLRARGLMRG